MKRAKKHRRHWLISVGCIVLLLAAYVIWALRFSYPDLKPTYLIYSYKINTTSNSLPFPAYGESALGIGPQAVTETSGKQTPVPIASVAKVITALVVLNKYPITNISTSPVITMKDSDVGIYQSYLLEGGSVVPVVAGEKLSEYQMLEAMLLPSGDNIADSLAIWAFGSLSSYSSYANNYLAKNGLSETKVGVDASGYDPSSVSTATDLIKLGQLVTDSPVLSQIVATKEADLPVAGIVKNINSLLGQNGINGIKTGNTTQAGGVFLASAQLSVNNSPLTIYTAVMGAPTLWDALNASYRLITATQANFATPVQLTSIQRGTLVGKYSVPWSKQKIDAVSNSNLPLVVFKSDPVVVNVLLNRVSDKAKSGYFAGIITARDTKLNAKLSTKVYLNRTIPKPSKWWLLLHPGVSLQL